MSEYILNVEVREELGKGASRRLRHTDKVPAVVYGGDADAVSLTMKINEITRCLMDKEFYSSTITLQYADGKSEQVSICDLQRHPVKEHAIHADFRRA